MRRLFLATLGMLALAGTSVTHAALTLFSDQSSFLAAVTGPVTQNFEGIAPPASFVLTPGETIGIVTYGTPSDFLGVVDPAFDPQYDFGTGAVMVIAVDGTTVTVTFPSAQAFGLLLGTNADMGGTVTVTVAGETYDISTADALPSLQFIGFLSDTPFTSVSFTGFDTFAAILDDVIVAGIPEPMSLVLFGGALLALGASTRRRG